jgi:hypothetical protein
MCVIIFCPWGIRPAIFLIFLFVLPPQDTTATTTTATTNTTTSSAAPPRSKKPVVDLAVPTKDLPVADPEMEKEMEWQQLKKVLRLYLLEKQREADPGAEIVVEMTHLLNVSAINDDVITVTA